MRANVNLSQNSNDTQVLRKRIRSNGLCFVALHFLPLIFAIEMLIEYGIVEELYINTHTSVRSFYSKDVATIRVISDWFMGLLASILLLFAAKNLARNKWLLIPFMLLTLYFLTFLTVVFCLILRTLDCDRLPIFHGFIDVIIVLPLMMKLASIWQTIMSFYKYLNTSTQDIPSSHVIGRQPMPMPSGIGGDVMAASPMPPQVAPQRNLETFLSTSFYNFKTAFYKPFAPFHRTSRHHPHQRNRALPQTQEGAEESGGPSNIDARVLTRRQSNIRQSLVNWIRWRSLEPPPQYTTETVPTIAGGPLTPGQNISNGATANAVSPAGETEDPFAPSAPILYDELNENALAGRGGQHVVINVVPTAPPYDNYNPLDHLPPHYNDVVCQQNDQMTVDSSELPPTYEQAMSANLVKL